MTGTHSNARTHAITVDVEDWFQVWALSEKISRSSWDGFTLRVEQSTNRVLDLFDQYGARGTFFTLGWVAERCPGLIRDIVARGHELASHGWDHTKVFDQSRDAFFRDAGKTKKVLEDIAGVRVSGYRAAGFSIDARTPWAHEVLADLGYRYSSSLHPVANDHYDGSDAPLAAFEPLANRTFREVPVSVVEMWGRRFSCAGGGWFRLLPYQWSSMLMERHQAQSDRPMVFYFHPWEIDPQQPRIRGISRKSQFRHYTNLDRMESKLSKLLARCRWDRMDAVFDITDTFQDAA